MLVLTGASSGIGRAAAVELAGRGGTLILVGRDSERLEAAAGDCGEAGADAIPIRSDFESLDDVRRLAAELLARGEPIEVLASNAGTYVERRRLTVDGHERTFAVNHLAPFLLVNLLLERLQESGARIVVTSSDAHRGGLIDFDDIEMERRWSGLRAYSASKLANVLFTRELARRLRGSGAVANCFHPGVVATRLVRGGPSFLVWAPVRILGRRPRSGAGTLVYLATAPEAGEVSGEYFVDRRPVQVLGQAADDDAARLLWERSAELVGVPAA